MALGENPSNLTELHGNKPDPLNLSKPGRVAAFMHRLALAGLLLAPGCQQPCPNVNNDSNTPDDTSDQSNVDNDGDGVTPDYGDCDDTNPLVKPDAQEAWYDGIDQNCDGLSDFDADMDGYDATVYGGDDCDDTDPARNPAEDNCIVRANMSRLSEYEGVAPFTVVSDAVYGTEDLLYVGDGETTTVTPDAICQASLGDGASAQEARLWEWPTCGGPFPISEDLLVANNGLYENGETTTDCAGNLQGDQNFLNGVNTEYGTSYVPVTSGGVHYFAGSSSVTLPNGYPEGSEEELGPGAFIYADCEKIMKPE